MKFFVPQHNINYNTWIKIRDYAMPNTVKYHQIPLVGE